MDTITQAALGAAVGQTMYAHKLGRKANWYGALAGLLPDLDVLARPMADEWQVQTLADAKPKGPPIVVGERYLLQGLPRRRRNV